MTAGRDSVLDANVTREFKYNIKITQIDCSSDNKEIMMLRG